SKSMIEDQEHPGDHEHHFGNFQVIALVDRNCRLEKTDYVIADVADGPTNKMGNVCVRDETKTPERLLEAGQRITFALGAVEDGERVESDERKAPQLFVSFGRLEKEARIASVDLGEGRDRRFHVGDKIDHQRHKIAALGELAKLVARRSYVEGRHGAGDET